MGDTNGFRIENGKLISYTGDDLQITIPDEVTEIGNRAFINSGIRKAVIGDSVKIIGEEAFKDCKTLMEVSLPKDLEEIGNSVFAGCVGLQKIHGGSKIKSIGRSAFKSCSITEFDFSNVTSIGAEAFSCSKLTEVAFGRNLVSLDHDAFSYSNLRSVIFDADSPLETIEDRAFENCSVTNLQLPAHLKKIGYNAFRISATYDQAQKEIVLPDSLRIIGYGAFSGHPFELIVIPYGVTHIDSHSFDKTRKIIFPDVFRAQSYDIADTISGAMYYQTEEQYEKLKEYGFLMDGGNLIKFVRKASVINFPDFVTRICRDAIVDCGLCSTMIPEHTVIEVGAFRCPTLKYVTVSKQYKKKRKLYFGDQKIKYTFI